ncbi:MAG: hypothetical protein NW226_05585 [Microscillaceae bacterium]|nr:hypothetical protein [Microscillaceae bacterium]
MRLTIEINNVDELSFIRELLRKLQIPILSSDQALSDINIQDTAKTIALMEKIAERGTYTQDILDPKEWQRDIRQNRDLPFRED